MAGATSPLAFPYPTGTDRVMDGDNAIQALAEKVDDYLETVYSAPCALAGGVTGSAMAYKNARVVIVALGLTPTALLPAFSALCTLPGGFTADAGLNAVAWNNSASVPVGVYIDANVIRPRINIPAGNLLLGEIVFMRSPI